MDNHVQYKLPDLESGSQFLPLLFQFFEKIGKRSD